LHPSFAVETEIMPRPLRIAQVASIIFPVPPKRYGGTERAISYLTEALVAAGHDVTLFACGDAITSARLIASRPEALSGAHVANALPHFAAHYALVRRHLAEFDIVHFHDEGMHFPCFMDIAERSITTFHMPLAFPPAFTTSIPSRASIWPSSAAFPRPSSRTRRSA
jgi:glycosyltransferase involved in cell wall biosynthesis